jgi:radical SAM-linked protein
MSLRGHLDFIKVIARVLRRARLPLFYTEGFSPRPLMSFGPALGLGLQSVAEYADVALTLEIEGAELVKRFDAASEPGLTLFGARRLREGEPPLARRIDSVDYVVALPPGDIDYRARVEAFHALRALEVEVIRKGKRRSVDAKKILLDARIAPAGEHASLLSILPGEEALHLRLREASGVASLRPAELAAAVLGTTLPPSAFLRTACGEPMEESAQFGTAKGPDVTVNPTM